MQPADNTTVRDPPTGISGLVCGAGVAGLMAAIELWRRGCDVQILERTSSSSTAGDAFTIGPSALQMLRNWPEMQARHDQIAYEPMFAKYTHTGERLMEPVRMGAMFKQKGMKTHPRLRIHSRPKLHDMLLEQLAKCKVHIEYGTEVVEYFEDIAREKAGVVLRDGSRREADLVVAADGLRGKSWDLITGSPVPARSSGSAALRAAYPVELALKIPGVAERFPLEDDNSSIWQSWAGGKVFGAFWRTDDQMMFIITHPDDGTAEESWSHFADREHVETVLSSIPDRLELYDQIIKAAPAESIIDWKIMWREPQPKWTSPGGYVVQLGDAAHSFLPSSGNGGTQALEDGVSLAACVAMAGKQRIPDATRVHNLLRFERVSFIQAMGVSIRDAKTKSGSGKSKTVLTPGAWLTGHDPERYVEENFAPALAHLQHGAPFQNTNKPPHIQYQSWTIDGLVEALHKGEPTILDGDWS